MKVKDADILIVPGYTNSGPDHWQTRWQSKLSTARRVEQADWSNPDRDDWVEALAAAVDAATRPVVLVAHSLGVSTVVHAAASFRKPVAGAFLVAPPDLANPEIRPKHLMTFGPYPRDPLPFPSILVASRNDPFCAFDVAETSPPPGARCSYRRRRGRPCQHRFRLRPVAGRFHELRPIPLEPLIPVKAGPR